MYSDEAAGWQFIVQIPVGTRDFSLFQTSEGGRVVVVRWLYREVNHSTPVCAKVKNEWNSTSASPVCCMLLKIKTTVFTCEEILMHCFMHHCWAALDFVVESNYL